MYLLNKGNRGILPFLCQSIEQKEAFAVVHSVALCHKIPSVDTPCI